MIRGFKIMAAALLLVGLAAGVSISDRHPAASDEEPYRDCPAYVEKPAIFMAQSGQTYERAAQVSEAVALKQSGRDGTLAGIYPRNYIDVYILDKMAADGVPSAPLTDNYEFVRRAYLDLTGRVPSIEEVRLFIANPDRSALIDNLMLTPEFVDQWTMYFGDLLKNTSAGQTLYSGRTPYYQYIRDAVQTNKNYAHIAVDTLMLPLQPSPPVNSWVNGPVNFFARSWEAMVNPYDIVDNIAIQAARVYLGVPVLCISCHNGQAHLEAVNLYLSTKRRQQHFWGLAAFFSDVRVARRLETSMPNTYSFNATELAIRQGYDVRLPAARNGIRPPRFAPPEGPVVYPRYFFTEDTAYTSDFRYEFVRSMLADPQFSRAAVNYVWKELFGVGIVDLPDAFDLARQDPLNPPPTPWTIQPTHPELLVALGDDFAIDFDLQRMIKLIMNSTTYQLSASYPGTWEGRYSRYFARRFARRMSAEQVLDWVFRVSGNPGNFVIPDIGVVQYAMQLPDPTEPRAAGSENATVRTFLAQFFRGNRDTLSRSPEGSTLQALALMNNPLIQSRMRVGAGWITDILINSGMTTDQLIDEAFLIVGSREATLEERTVARQMINANRSTGVDDLLRALLCKLDLVHY